MPLSLSILQSSGVTVTYWKVGQMQINNIAHTIDAEIYGYLDLDSYNNGFSPVTSIPITLGSSDFATILTSPTMISTFYTIISNLSVFTGSIVI